MNNILLVIDVQNGFLRNNATRQCAQKIGNLLNSNLFNIVTATQFRNRPESPYRRFLGWSKMVSLEEQQLIPAVKENAVAVFEKFIYTCVNNDFMDSMKKLNNNKLPQQIFLCGIDTDSCVLKIAVDLFEHNIQPLILKAYCNSNGGAGSHRAGITALKRFIGENSLIDGEIKNIRDINKALSKKDIIYKYRASLPAKAKIKSIIEQAEIKYLKGNALELIQELADSMSLSQRINNPAIDELLKGQQKKMFNAKLKVADSNKVLANYCIEWEKETIALYGKLLKHLEN